jgi:hypothetical protein
VCRPSRQTFGGLSVPDDDEHVHWGEVTTCVYLRKRSYGPSHETWGDGS